MQYYTLTHAVDTEQTGPAFPQVSVKGPRIYPHPILLANNANNGTYPPDNMPPFDYLQLNKGAKLTDLMSSPFSNGFLISEKLKQLFIESNITDYKIYDVALLDTKNKLIDGYFYFHSASCLREFIDYPKSKFFVGDLIQHYIRDCTTIFSNYNDLDSYDKTLPFGEELLWVKQFYLKSSFPFQTDLFRLCVSNIDFFITEQLKQKLEHNNITGIEINSVSDFIKTPNLA